LCFLFLASGVLYLTLAEDIKKTVEERWTEINSNLNSAGIYIPKQNFINGIMLNIKFAGLYGLSFFLFMIIGFSGSLYQTYKLYQ
jgi:hypothetical protein